MCLWHNGFIIGQSHLENVVKALFPNNKLQINVRKDATIKNPKTGQLLEVDIWIPELQLCFEFQDIYHYTTTWYSQKPLYEIRHQDNLKQSILQSKSESLILVPYWWAGDKESLQGTIQFQRPDLFCDSSVNNFHPISINPPNIKQHGVPDIGELMLASFPLDSNLLLSSISLEKPWWVGEKYDGIRFCWSPHDRALYSRAGLPLPIPSKMVNQFGSLFLDGELWCGRGMYVDTTRAMLSSPTPALFAFTRNISFDIPSFEFRRHPFEHRYGVLLRSINPTHPFIHVAFRTKCTSNKLVLGCSEKIVEQGGEGIVLRQFASKYVPGRSPALYKLKSIVSDAEALVVGSSTSAVQLQLPSGKTFEVPNKERKDLILLKKGDIVTFGYTKQSQQSVPSDPSILRVRRDTTWEHIVFQYHNENNIKLPGGNKESVFSTKPSGFWRRNIRSFFEKFARDKNFDPLNATNWYSVPRKEVLQEKGGVTLIGKYFNGSLVRALLAVFPKIGLDRSKFSSLEKNFWQNERNRRDFFMSYAKDLGFDPLVANNWYACKSKFTLIRNMCTKMVDVYYGGSVSRALLHLFPDIGLDRKELYTPAKTWTSVSNRRHVMVTFAKEKGLDPLDPEAWYNFVFDPKQSSKEVRSVLDVYNGSYFNCLKDVFPELNLDASLFQHKHKNFWSNEQNRRNFFIQFAKVHGFDPLISKNWGSVTNGLIKKTKSGSSVLEYYGYSHIRALIALFPDIGLTRETFAGNKSKKLKLQKET